MRLGRVRDHQGDSLCDARRVARWHPPALRGAAVGEPQSTQHRQSNLTEPRDRLPVWRPRRQPSGGSRSRCAAS
eukprot:748191-Prymnesium_polylepis.1